MNKMAGISGCGYWTKFSLIFNQLENTLEMFTVSGSNDVQIDHFLMVLIQFLKKYHPDKLFQNKRFKPARFIYDSCDQFLIEEIDFYKERSLFPKQTLLFADSGDGRINVIESAQLSDILDFGIAHGTITVDVKGQYTIVPHLKVVLAEFFSERQTSVERGWFYGSTLPSEIINCDYDPE